MRKPYTPAADSILSDTISLAALTTALGTADDEQSILATTLAYLHGFGPQAARLVYVYPNLTPAESQVVAGWPDGQGDAGAPAERLPIAMDSLIQQCLGKTPEPLLIPDIDQASPSLLAAARTYCNHLMNSPSSGQAMALLPLRSGRGGSCQGLLVLIWTTPHVFSAEEAEAYGLLTAVLGLALGGLRAEHELAEAHSEAALLQEVMRKLNVAGTIEEILGALLIPAPARDEAEVSLCAIESQPNGTPGWLTVVGTWTASGLPLRTQPGVRYFLPDIPFSKLYTSSPDAPLLISNIEQDPRVDDYARSLYAAGGIKSTIVMALTLQGRWVGLFSVTWKRPVALTQREQRQYQSLAKQAALLLDNNLMVERLRTSLRETQQQGALLQTILDHIPVGVVLLEIPSARVLIGNTFAERLFGRAMDKQIPGVSAATVAAYQFVKPGTDIPLAAEELAATRTLRSGKPETTEMDILRTTGERLNSEANAVPICDEHGVIKQIIVLITDLTTRKRAERERAQLQEQVIQVQAAALAERSSPLIPITDEILVLPLIGSIDAERGNQVLDTVLQGTSQRGARVAIIDITGVNTIDTHAAAALTGAAQALRLLGVEPVLTGIRAEVAQTLVSLGIALTGIVTRSTLQSGIQYALRRLGKQLVQ